MRAKFRLPDHTFKKRVLFRHVDGIFCSDTMSQAETEHLNRIVISAALSRAISSVAEFGIADLIQPGEPQTVSHLASASRTNEPVL